MTDTNREPLTPEQERDIVRGLRQHDPNPPERPPRAKRYPPTWFVVTLWVIVASVFIFRWDYGQFSDFLMGACMGIITTWWAFGRTRRTTNS